MGRLSIGISFNRLNPAAWTDVALQAEEQGFESIWVSDHTVFPLSIAGSPFINQENMHTPFNGDEHDPATCDYCLARAKITAEVRPNVPVLDAMSVLSYVAGRTQSIRLGTWVYVLALRHPLMAARAAQTLDFLSNGRLIFGVGTGWCESEWDALDVDFASRGERLSESIDVCRRLWSEETIEHHGKFFNFEAVAFEPKPVQQPLPVHVGGESPAALRRAARRGDGWIGMIHTPESARDLVRQLDELRQREGTWEKPFEITVGGDIRNQEELREWEASGVSRVIATPWARSSQAASGLNSLAEIVGYK